MSNNFNLNLLNNLSDKEKEVALSILNELSNTGSSNILDKLKYEDYAEMPATIEEFLHNPEYLGSALIDEEGRYTLFPYWEDVLKKIFPTNIDTAYNTFVATGGIGLGKSTVADIAGIYILHRVMCLKNAYTHYGLQEIDIITFAFLNITLDTARGVAWSKFQQMIQKSPWFMKRGALTRSKDPEWYPDSRYGIELIYGSRPNHILGRCLLYCFVDEVSFQPNKDLNQQIEKAKQIVNAAAIRMQSRFMKGENNPTLLALASSKRTEQSYLETFIQSKKDNDSKTTLIVDEPQWVIRTDKDSPNKFKVALGNKFLESEILPLGVSDDIVTQYRNRGYSILEVPMGYYENFLDDLNTSLTDIAGISVSLASRFISGQRWADCKDEHYRNPFTKDVIVVGNARDDTTEYYDYFDMSAVDPKLMKYPLYVHLDMSVSGDKTGIAGTWLIGKRIRQNDNRNSDLYYQVCFSVSIKAPKGHQISFQKNRRFVRWLKKQGFNVKGVSSDTYQSYDLQQSLSSEGFDCKIISVDRCTDKVCIPYQTLKTAIYERRIIVYNKCDLLTEEVIGLEKNNNTGAVDHTAAGINTKDQIDAVCGSLYNASQHGEEFAHDYGETYEQIIAINGDAFQNTRNQITMDFEEALKQIQDPLHITLADVKKVQQKPSDGRMDFGFGKAQPLINGNLANGILLW